MIAAIVSEMVSRAKAARHVSISYSTQPKAQISVRLSTARPRACLGLTKPAGGVMGGEHRVDFVAERPVAGARVIEILRPGRRVARERRVEHFGDLVPALRPHAVARHAAP